MIPHPSFVVYPMIVQAVGGHAFYTGIERTTLRFDATHDLGPVELLEVRDQAIEGLGQPRRRGR